MQTDIQSVIKSRRSVRKYTDAPVSDETVNTILEAGRWAPSGLNNQPWRFAVIHDSGTRKKLAGLTKYSRIIKECNLCIAVFYNLPSGYNRDKDILSIGACIQNMLLSAHSQNIGAVWLGEILNRKDEVNGLLGINADNELMAVITLGHPDETPSSSRKELDSLLLGSF